MDTNSPLPVDFTAALEQFNSERDFMNEMFKEYAASLSLRMAEIHTALKEGSAEMLSKRAHNLKGVCLTFCARPVTELARQIEEAGKGGDMTNMSALVTQLDEEMHRLEEYLANNLPR